MIIVNGHIETKQKVAGGLNSETGYPNRPSEISWNDPIPCQYIANKYTNLGRVNGEHAKFAAYQVLIEAQPFEAEQIRLSDRDGNLVGEFSIIWVEPLDAVDELRIWI